MNVEAFLKKQKLGKVGLKETKDTLYFFCLNICAGKPILYNGDFKKILLFMQKQKEFEPFPTVSVGEYEGKSAIEVWFSRK
jgi:hypothetical protein